MSGGTSATGSASATPATPCLAWQQSPWPGSLEVAALGAAEECVPPQCWDAPWLRSAESGFHYAVADVAAWSDKTGLDSGAGVRDHR